MMRRARHGWIALAVSIAACGCQRETAPTLVSWAPQPLERTPIAGSSNGYDDLALAALDAESEVDSKYLKRVYFPPKMRENLIRDTRSAVNRVAVGLGKKIEFDFTARAPFEAARYHKGWRAIGRGLVWRIEDACANANYDAAVHDAVLATRFGYELTGGGAVEASLGLVVADEARRALAPYLQDMGAGQLQALASGMERALDSRPPLDQTFRHERDNMMRSVQYVQDQFLRNDFAALDRQLGPSVRDAVRYLHDLRGEKPGDQAAYFQGFAAEAEERARRLIESADLSAAEREALPEVRLADSRPWRRLARHFFTAGDAVLEEYDATLARTRLLILESRILASVKSSGVAPKSLPDGDQTTDPYSGKPFPYRASGTEYKLYSVGPDLKDDGGETGPSFTTPDLKLERPTS